MTIFNLEEQLEIIIPTYNRKDCLTRTLEQLTASKNPVRNCPITLLDNASDDGTSDVIARFAAQFANIKHIRHTKNIGGNSNITRAFELATKPYVWVLGDDDEYDFSHAQELLPALQEQPDALFVVKTDGPLTSDGRIFKELTFIAGAIYRTSLITSDVLTNMYFNISNMFPQLVLAAHVFNTGGKINILPHPLVIRQPDAQYKRGIKWCHPLMNRMDWLYGYVASVPLLQAPALQAQCIRDLRIDGEGFYNCCGRFMAQAQNKIFLYGAGLMLFPGKYKFLFALVAWPAFVCSFYTTDRGLYARLFGGLKFKILPKCAQP